jgi:hypothetical protein
MEENTMGSFLRLVAVFALTMCFVAGSALAVGYERIPVRNTRPVKVHPIHSYVPHGWASVKKASFVDKIPVAIDDAAMTVKGLLSQFGLTGKNAR